MKLLHANFNTILLTLLLGVGAWTLKTVHEISVVQGTTLVQVEHLKAGAMLIEETRARVSKLELEVALIRAELVAAKK